jgi:Septum formation
MPLWRRIPLGWILFAGLIAVGAVTSWYFSASRSDSGEITGSGDLDVNDLRVGDCFDFKDPEAEEFDEVTARPCTEEHEYEMFFVGTMSAGTYPTDAGFDSYVSSACEPAFATYVGRSFESSRLELTWVAPTSDGWKSGDHAIQCLLNDPQRPRLTTSLQGSNL